MARKHRIGGYQTSLVERAKNDKKTGAGVGRGNKMQATRAAFKAWLLIPHTFLGAGEPILRALGITDPEAVELCMIRTQSEFAEKFNVFEPTLSHWKKEMRNGDDFGDLKTEMRQLTKNVMGALYRKAIAEGDAARVKLWLQAVEGWNETMGQNITVEDGLTDESKKALDRLIEKNRVRI